MQHLATAYLWSHIPVVKSSAGSQNAPRCPFLIPRKVLHLRPNHCLAFCGTLVLALLCSLTAHVCIPRQYRSTFSCFHLNIHALILLCSLLLPSFSRTVFTSCVIIACGCSFLVLCGVLLLDSIVIDFAPFIGYFIICSCCLLLPLLLTFLIQPAHATPRESLIFNKLLQEAKYLVLQGKREEFF